MAHELDYMSAAEMRLRVARKDVSPVELVGRALERAEATEPKLNAFFVLQADAAPLPVSHPVLQHKGGGGGVADGATVCATV